MEKGCYGIFTGNEPLPDDAAAFVDSLTTEQLIPIPQTGETRYQYCTAMPVGTLLAQSWDPELLAEVGKAVLNSS